MVVIAAKVVIEDEKRYLECRIEPSKFGDMEPEGEPRDILESIEFKVRVFAERVDDCLDEGLRRTAEIILKEVFRLRGERENQSTPES